MSKEPCPCCGREITEPCKGCQGQLIDALEELKTCKAALANIAEWRARGVDSINTPRRIAREALAWSGVKLLHAADGEKAITAEEFARILDGVDD